MNVHPKSAPTPFPAASYVGATGQPRPHSAHQDPGRRDRDKDGEEGDEEVRDPRREPQERPPERKEEPSPDETGEDRRQRKMTAASLALCSAAAIALLAFVPAAPTLAAPQDGNADDADSAQPVTDTWITSKVKAQLATTEGVKSLDVSVTTVNGVVTLIGIQPTELAVKKAVAVAKAVKGVKEVDASGLKAKS